MHHGYKSWDTLRHQLSHDRKQDVNNDENLSDSIPYSSFTNGNLRCDLWDIASLRLLHTRRLQCTYAWQVVHLLFIYFFFLFCTCTCI